MENGVLGNMRVREWFSIEPKEQAWRRANEESKLYWWGNPKDSKKVREAKLSKLQEKAREEYTRQQTHMVTNLTVDTDEIIQLIKKVEKEMERINSSKEKRINVLDQAKEVGAKLFVIGERIMKENPNLTGQELKKLILSEWEKKWFHISDYQRRVLEKQADIYDSLKIQQKERIKWWFDEAWIEMPTDLKKAQEMMNTNKELNFIIWKNTATKWMSDINIITQLWAIEQLFGLEKIESSFTKRFITLAQTKEWTEDLRIEFRILRNDPNKWNEILHDLHRVQNGIVVDIINNPLAIGIYANGTHLSLFGDEFKSKLWYFNVGDPIIYATHGASKDVIDHEYQHFLNHYFLDEIMLFKEGKSSTLKDASTRIWRWFYNEKWKEWRGIWVSMQDELCSYIERNGELRKDIHPYLNFKKEISDESRIEIEKAIQQLDIYFTGTILSKEELVGIIRTSHSIPDMLERLNRKKTQNLTSRKIDIPTINPRPRWSSLWNVQIW